MNWAIHAALYLAVLAMGFKTGVEWEEGQTARRDVARMASESRSTARKERQADTGAKRYEADKVRIHTEYVPITQEIERVIEKPVYRNVCLDDDGLRLITRAIAAGHDPGQLAPTLP